MNDRTLNRISNPWLPCTQATHGNAEAIQHRWERVKLFTDNGYGILIVSYRGFAGSTGHPTEAGLHLDAKAALRFLEVKGLAALASTLTT